MLRMNFPNRKEKRMQEATLRQEERGKRTDEEQIAKLDNTLGTSNGAKKERARLTAKLSNK